MWYCEAGAEGGREGGCCDSRAQGRREHQGCREEEGQGLSERRRPDVAARAERARTAPETPPATANSQNKYLISHARLRAAAIIN